MYETGPKNNQDEVWIPFPVDIIDADTGLVDENLSFEMEYNPKTGQLRMVFDGSWPPAANDTGSDGGPMKH